MKTIEINAISSDPELFICSSGTNQIASAIHHIDGTKENPMAVTHGHIQHDGILAEMNPKPATTREDFVTNTHLLVDELNEYLAERGLESRIMASSHVDESLFDCEEARIFGCMPDLNVWTGMLNPAVDPVEVGDLRVAGGHVHISFRNPVKRAPKANFVKALDVLAGLPSILVDNDNERRTMYGRAGSYRNTVYPDGTGGVEYRTLSNFWIASKKLTGAVYDAVQAASDVAEDKAFLKLLDRNEQNIITTINNAQTAKAEQLCKTFGVEVTAWQ